MSRAGNRNHEGHRRVVGRLFSANICTALVSALTGAGSRPMRPVGAGIRWRAAARLRAL
jgi:hypothetical protein